MDVDILAAGDGCLRAPARHAEISGYGAREVARVGKDRDRALAQRLRRVVAAERTTDTHLIPGIGNPEAVAAEDIDAVLLPHGTDFARVVDGELLGDDEDLPESRIHANQLGHAIARARRREIDYAAVEVV